MRNSIFILSLLITCNCLSQRGFKEQIAIEIDEPNIGYHVLEDTINRQYLVSGQYFDQEIGRWTALVSNYTYDGNLSRVHTLQSDTVPFLDYSNHSQIIGNKYYISGLGPTTTNVVCFDLDNSELSVIYSHDRFDNVFNKNLGIRSYLIDETRESVFICGSMGLNFNGSKKGAVVYSLGRDQKIFFDTTITKNLIALNIKRNSEENFVIAARSSTRPLDASQDTCHLYFLDDSLNLLKSTYDNPINPNFRIGKGMLIDYQDNILITGAKQLPSIDTPDALNKQGVVKFDQEGNYIWTSFISNSINNVSGWGKWHSIVESHERDGYIIAGSESYQTEAQDTMISKAAIAKISSDGDSIWMHTFSYREGRLLREEFHDIAVTSDGGYIAAGSSAHYEPFDEIELPWIRTIILKVDKDGLLDTTSVSVLNINTEENNLSIYPNPVIGDHLYITQSLDQDLLIMVYNIQGQLMDSYTSDNAQHTIILDVAAYDPGLYIVTATNDRGHKYSRKFVVD